MMLPKFLQSCRRMEIYDYRLMSRVLFVERVLHKDSTLCIIIALLVFSQEQLEHQQPFCLVHVRAVH